MDMTSPQEDNVKQPVGRPSLGVTKKVSLTLSGSTWDWLERQAEGSQSKMLRSVILNSMRRSMISDLLCEFSNIEIRCVKGNCEYSERVVVPKGLKEAVISYVTSRNMLVIEKGTWVENQNYMVIDVALNSDAFDYVDDHILISE